MNKIVVGLLAGAALGAIDGATAWFTPAVRDQIGQIIMWSTMKGLIVGVLAGWFAVKVQSLKWGIVIGAVIGLLFAFLVAMQPDPKTGQHYYFEIMLPGFIAGAIIGFFTQRLGTPAPLKRIN